MFEQQVEQLSRMCQILSLPEAVRALLAGSIPDRAVCITFDDGYQNNHDVAAPILRRYGAPATFFVTRDAVREGIMWNDLVIEAVRRAGNSIDLTAAGLSNNAIVRTSGPAKLAESILTQLKYVPAMDRLVVARQLFESVTSTSPPRLMMTESEVARLGKDGFDIGGHTVTHPILSVLEPQQAAFEIAGCASWLKDLIGAAPVSFAYPNGRPGRDFRPEHVELVRNAGFKVAVTTSWACATRSSDCLQIPRASLSGAAGASQFSHLLKLLLSSYR